MPEAIPIPEGATLEPIKAVPIPAGATLQAIGEDKPPAKGLLRRAAESVSGFPDIPSELAAGAVKGAGSTAYGAAKLINQGLRLIPGLGPTEEKGLSSLITGKPTKKEGLIAEFPEKPEVLKPKTKAEKVGFGAEQIGEYFIPLGEEKLAAYGATKGIPRIARVVADALKAGTVGTAQTGSVKQGAAIGATAGATSALTPVIGSAMAKIGKKIQLNTIRARAIDRTDGFSWETIKKLGLKGNLEQSFKQIENKLAELRNARNALIAPGTANVNLDSIFSDAMNEVAQKANTLEYGHMGANATEGVYKAWLDLSELRKGNLNVDVSDAENLKEFFGTLGSWAYGKGDPDAKVKEMVANTIYSKLKTGIENSIGAQGPTVRALNKEMQQIIPVKHAMVSRIPVEERNRMFSLPDIAAMLPAVATGDVSRLGLLALTMAQKSLRFGNWLTRSAPAITKIGTPVGKIAAGTLSTAESLSQ